MNNHYIAVTVCEGGKNYAYVVKVREDENLLSKLEIKNIKTANIFSTKKEAKIIAEYWNKCYKDNGTYMFDESWY